MVAYTKQQKRKIEDSERLRGEREHLYFLVNLMTVYHRSRSSLSLC